MFSSPLALYVMIHLVLHLRNHDLFPNFCASLFELAIHAKPNPLMKSNFCIIQVVQSLFKTITPCLFVCFLQWELHTICPQKEYTKTAITLNLISGLWAVYCMRQVSSNFFFLQVCLNHTIQYRN